MATKIWKGTAQPIAQADTLTVGGTIETTDKFIVTLTDEDGNTQTVTVIAGSTNASTVAASIRAALAASTQTLFTAITWTVNGVQITGTANTAGVPFYCAASTTEGDDSPADAQTFVRAASVANSGPNDWNTAANWEDGTKPASADTIHLTNNAVDILYGLDQSAISPTALNIEQSYTGLLGQADAYLKTKPTSLNIGEHYGSTTPAGSRRIKVNTLDAASIIAVYNSATAAVESNLPPIRLLGANISALRVQRGKVGVACESPAETSIVDALTVAWTSNANTDADVITGPGAALTTITKTGGQLTVRSSVTTIDHRAGTMQTAGTGTVGTLTNHGGTIYPNATGAITTLHCNGGVTDFTRSAAARTVANADISKGASLSYDPNVVTFTNKIAATEPLTLTAT